MKARETGVQTMSELGLELSDDLCACEIIPKTARAHQLYNFWLVKGPLCNALTSGLIDYCNVFQPSEALTQETWVKSWSDEC